MSFPVAAGLLACVCAVTCAIPGIFLLLRRQAMLVDAMSHAVLPGIVIGAYISGSTHSPLMIMGAATLGLIVVLGAAWLRNTGLIAGDANQGLIFPVLFSIGVLLLSTSLHSVHICSDTVLSGDLNLQALGPERLLGGGFDFGPRTMWTLLGICALNLGLLAVGKRALTLTTFDPDLARTQGVPVRTVNLVFMLAVALTVVTSFSTAGSILVVALMIAPPATARLLVGRLRPLLGLTVVFALASSLGGFLFAWYFDLATAATISVVQALVFLLVFSLVSLRRAGAR